MKAILFDKHGELDVLHYDDVDTPEPEQGEVRVAVEACRAATPPAGWTYWATTFRDGLEVTVYSSILSNRPTMIVFE